MPATITRPIEFRGTDEQRAANRATHAFDYGSEDARCWHCDCRPGGQVANYPCGVEPPRETIEVGQ